MPIPLSFGDLFLFPSSGRSFFTGKRLVRDPTSFFFKMHVFLFLFPGSLHNSVFLYLTPPLAPSNLRYAMRSFVLVFGFLAQATTFFFFLFSSPLLTFQRDPPRNRMNSLSMLGPLAHWSLYLSHPLFVQTTVRKARAPFERAPLCFFKLCPPTARIFLFLRLCYFISVSVAPS